MDTYLRFQDSVTDQHVLQYSRFLRMQAPVKIDDMTLQNNDGNITKINLLNTNVQNHINQSAKYMKTVDVWKTRRGRKGENKQKTYKKKHTTITDHLPHQKNPQTNRIYTMGGGGI